MNTGVEGVKYLVYLSIYTLWMAHIGQKVSLIAFRQILLKLLAVVELYALIQIIVLQDYLPQLYPSASSLLPKNVPSFNIFCCSCPVWTTLPLLPNLCGKPWGWGKNTAQQLIISWTRKTPLTK